MGDVSYGGKRPLNAVGLELMLGHTLGDHYDEPVLLLRCGTRGMKSLSHDYCPPSSDGGQDMEGSWDVIHFNWGVWDIGYRNPLSTDWAKRDKINGEITTPIDVYEKNLRMLVARMKKTGATLIWGSTTPAHKDCIGRFQKDLDAPELPVVVTAIGAGGQSMSAHAKVVHDAQMNVAAMPEFAGNVVSVDTRDFYRSPDVSPSSDSGRYNNNAQSFLEIGEAVGRALLELQD